MNTIRLGMSNARIEATNNKIKLIIRKAYGFRNIQNMLDMVYLVCSNLEGSVTQQKNEIGQIRIETSDVGIFPHYHPRRTLNFLYQSLLLQNICNRFYKFKVKVEFHRNK